MRDKTKLSIALSCLVGYIIITIFIILSLFGGEKPTFITMCVCHTLMLIIGLSAVIAIPTREKVSTSEKVGSENDFKKSWDSFSEETFKLYKEKGWYDRPLNEAEQIALMHSELSEALEGIRKNLKDDHLPNRLMLECELADVVIRIMNFSKHRGGIDVAGAIIEKHQYNKTRPYKHGGKAF